MLKKRELMLGLTILGAVSALCVRGMKAAGRMIAARTAREDAHRYRRDTSGDKPNGPG